MPSRSLVGKVCLLLCLAQVPLVGFLLAVGLTTKASITEHAQALLQAAEVRGLAATSLALVLTQQDVTKSMLVNPDNIVEAPRKIQAHDDNIAALHRMQALAASSAVADLVQQLVDMDDRDLTPLDTTILETLGAGQTEAAQTFYASTYEPKRRHYETLTRRLGDIADTRMHAAADRMAASNRRAMTWISVALGGAITI